jgi:hypothetical protein
VVEVVRAGKVRSATGAVRKRKTSSSGKPVFDDAVLTDLIGKLIRTIDRRGNAYGKGEGYQKCVKAMEGVEAAWRQWRVQG